MTSGSDLDGLEQRRTIHVRGATWAIGYDRSSSHWIGVCDEHKLTTSAETSAELCEVIEDVMRAHFDALRRDGLLTDE